MNRVAWFIICTVVGLELIAWGLLAPAQIRAVDAKVLAIRGAGGQSLVDEGLSLARLEKIGPARMLLQVADQTTAPDRESLAATIKKYEEAHPNTKLWGGAALYLERVFEEQTLAEDSKSFPIVDILIWQDARETLVKALGYSRRPGVLDILKTRELTNTIIFPPAASASGEPMEAAIATTALLFQLDYFAPRLRDAVQTLATNANRGGTTEPLELVYLDILALGKRLDWIQLVTLVKRVSDTDGLQQAARLVRERERELPVVYAAIHFADSPEIVAKYLDGFPKSGMKDLGVALRAGAGAVRDLLQRQQPIHYPTIRDKFVKYWPIGAVHEPMARIVAEKPMFGSFLKYGLCLLGALLIARALTYLSPSLVEEIVRSQPWVTGPQLALALCLLSFVLFFTETRMTWAAPAAESQMRLKIPMASTALRATISHQVRAMTDKLSVLSLLIFFFLQTAIYVFCRMKLAEIRRQNVSSKLKLRLLENEEHLFDAGLYFGFVGTVISFMLWSLKFANFSLMAAYSSTSFGIIFVSIVKIFHLRPYRRRLILDAEMTERETQTT